MLTAQLYSYDFALSKSATMDPDGSPWGVNTTAVVPL